MAGHVKLGSFEFRREREAGFRELEALIRRVETGGLRSLRPGDVLRLPVLYRATVSSLSVARAISLDRNLLDYLESLCARAYVQVYAPKRRLAAAAAEFLRDGFPFAVRSLRRPIALAAMLLLLGVVAGFALTVADPENFYSLVSEDLAAGRDPAASTESLRAALYCERAPPGGSLAFFTAGLFTHNARVGFLAFFLGFFAGVPAFALLFVNGLTLGAFAGLHHSRGLTVDLLGWLLPHGITELTAVVLCGGAGLALGSALVFPGRRTRLSSLAAAGREGARVVLGTVPLFFVAGLVEGVLRQTVMVLPARLAIAASTAVFLLAWFLLLGRRSK
ncbi:MAG: stage II sporulation protein M [Planctomycetes bacterium]|jgi:uncharacterized membrane protein SpoIIM required for sporulation|nr:stage II sporulation protein M [Planctomycetota bacterium]